MLLTLLTLTSWTAYGQSDWVIRDGDTLRLVPVQEIRVCLITFAERDMCCRLSDSLRVRWEAQQALTDALEDQLAGWKHTAQLRKAEAEAQQRAKEASQAQTKIMKRRRWAWGAGGAAVGLLVGILVTK